jgi:DNA-binding transcriptional MerR regulator
MAFGGGAKGRGPLPPPPITYDRTVGRASSPSWIKKLVPVHEDIPQKQFYTIGEVSRITGVRPHVLRYWESRGKILRPSRRKSRHRIYRPADIQLIFELKRLREEEKMTLPAMRRQLKEQVGQYHRTRHLPTPPSFPPVSHPVLALLEEIRKELLAVKELLE